MGESLALVRELGDTGSHIASGLCHIVEDAIFQLEHCMLRGGPLQATKLTLTLWPHEVKDDRTAKWWHTVQTHSFMRRPCFRA